MFEMNFYPFRARNLALICIKNTPYNNSQIFNRFQGLYSPEFLNTLPIPSNLPISIFHSLWLTPTLFIYFNILGARAMVLRQIKLAPHMLVRHALTIHP